MKNLFNKVKNTIISGIVLFLPVFILAAIFKKVYDFMFGFGHKFTQSLGLEKDFAPVLTTIFIIILFYSFGLLVRFSLVTKVKEWIENNVLVYIPPYSKYKAKMMAKLQPEPDLRQPVLVEKSDGWKPGFLIGSEGRKSTVFLPSTPDTDYGEVWIVDSSRISKLDITPKELKTSLLLSGKGFKIDQEQY
jgi:uncharacterized membrane protein